jgi:glutaredoxin
MEFENPSDTDFTVYSKSGCPNCSIVKKLLKDKNLIFNVVDCDDYVIEDRENFLLFIQDLSKQEIKQFPIIFHAGNFIGGYKDTKEYIDKLFLSFEDNLNF